MKNNELNEVLSLGFQIGARILGGAVTAGGVYEALAGALDNPGSNFLKNHQNELRVTLERLQQAVISCVYTYPSINLATSPGSRRPEKIKVRLQDFNSIIDSNILQGDTNLFSLMAPEYNIVNRVPITRVDQRLPILFAQSIGLNDRSISIFKKTMSVENIKGDYRDFTTCDRSKASIIMTVIDLFQDYMISQLDMIDNTYGASGPDESAPEDRRNYVEMPDWRRNELTFKIEQIKLGIKRIRDSVYYDAKVEFIHNEPGLVSLEDMVADALGGLWNYLVSDPFDLLVSLTGNSDKMGAGAIKDDCGKVSPGILTGKRFTN